MGLGERMSDLNGVVLTREQADLLRDAHKLERAIQDGEYEDEREREKGREKAKRPRKG